MKNNLLFVFLGLCTLSVGFFYFKPNTQNIVAEKIEKQPLAIEFEIERTKNPITGEVPSHLRYWNIVDQIMGFRGLHKTIRNYTNSWRPVDDRFAKLSVQKVVYDPNNPNIYYFCTGEGWFNADAVRGAGVWKSVDAGNSWQQLSATNTEDFYYCQDIKVHPDNSDIYVSTRNNGLMRSTNGGNSWEQVLGQGNGSIQNTAADIELTADGDIVVSIGIMNSDGIYISSTGESGYWNKISNSLPTSQRIEMAAAPSNANVIYAVTVSPNRIVGGIYKTNNKGQTWSALSLPGGNQISLASNQGWYDLILAVDPNNENILVAGGLHTWRTRDGGISWTRLTQGNRDLNEFPPYMHVDQHEVVFKNSDTVYFLNDGGIYVSYDFREAFPKFTQLNRNFNVTQYYAGDIIREKNGHRIIGGTQDNGTSGKIDAHNKDFEFISGGDGSHCAIDWEDPLYEYSTTQYQRFYRTHDRNRREISNTALGSTNTLFINPIHMDENDPKIIYQASSIGLWKLDNVRTARASDWKRVSAPFGAITAIATSKLAKNTILVARNGGGVFKIEDASKTTVSDFPKSLDFSQQLLQNGYPSNIEWDQNNVNHALVIYSNYGVNSVYQSKNVLDQAPNWFSCEGDLPDIPIRWAALHPDNSDVCYLATEDGIYYTTFLDGDNTKWTKSIGDVPNVRVDMIKIRKSDLKMMIATHGRGFFTADIGKDYSLVFKEQGPNNIGGRTRGLMLDPNDPSGKKIWAASVSGGLWVAQNIDSIEVYDESEIPKENEKEDTNFISTLIYPNPAHNYVKINFGNADDSQEIKVSIYNIEGKLIKKLVSPTPFKNKEINIEGLGNGMYLVLFEQGEERQVEKLVKLYSK